MKARSAGWVEVGARRPHRDGNTHQLQGDQASLCLKVKANIISPLDHQMEKHADDSTDKQHLICACLVEANDGRGSEPLHITKYLMLHGIGPAEMQVT